MRFIGIDLAWSLINADRPETGAAVIDESGNILSQANLSADESILDFVLSNIDQEGAIVAIDAPIVVPNLEGSRRCEIALQSMKIPVYPSNRSLLEKNLGGIRGEILAHKLEIHGFRIQDSISPGEPTKAIVEVYPRATISRLFGKVPSYKGSKAKRSVLAHGILHLNRLIQEALDPPIRWIHPPIEDPARLETLTPRQLKHITDILDAVLAAYVGYLAWKEDSRVEVIGDVHEGFILIPTTHERLPQQFQIRTPKWLVSEYKQQAIRFFKALVDADIATLERMLPQDYQGVELSNGRTLNIEDTYKTVSSLRGLGLHLDFEDIVGEDSKICVVYRISNRSTGKDVRCMSLLQFRQDKIQKAYHSHELRHIVEVLLDNPAEEVTHERDSTKH